MVDLERLDRIKKLMDKVKEIAASDENKQRVALWQQVPKTGRDQWRGEPRHDRYYNGHRVPLGVDLQNTFWCNLLNFSLVDYFNDPDVFLEKYLEIVISRYNFFKDDIFVSPSVRMWMGSGYEASLFGLRVKFSDKQDPWADFTPVIEDETLLAKMKIPDFYTSGQMPTAIKMYETVSKIVGDDFEVYFPEWNRSVFGLATYLRGYSNLLIDMVTNPDFTHQLFRFIVDSHKVWYNQYCDYFKKPMPKVNLFNDEVNCPSLSPALYEEFVLPYEIELSEFHNGLHYWHSCGNVTELLPLLQKIPRVALFHVGPWTDVAKAAKFFGQQTPLEICMDPQRDILDATPEQITEKIKYIDRTCRQNNVVGFTIRASAINYTGGNINTDLNKVSNWLSTARYLTTSLKD
jgi:uroporphyrinogen-III decarboxylase